MRLLAWLLLIPAAPGEAAEATVDGRIFDSGHVRRRSWEEEAGVFVPP